MKKRFVILLGLIPLFKTVWNFIKDRQRADEEEEALFERAVKEPEEAEEVEEADAAEESAPDQVNINTADAALLMTIPGIGEDLAGKIIHFRNEQGPFTALSELKGVSGIGDHKFEAISPYISC